MIANHIEGGGASFEFEELTEVDATEMRALVSLTNPGPFAERTHQLGRFIGVRRQGKLLAMAGEGMTPEGFTQVSADCAHPDCRGQGLAAALIREVSPAILKRGETPFLHAFDTNSGAIALYERLGFLVRWRPALMAFDTA